MNLIPPEELDFKTAWGPDYVDHSGGMKVGVPRYLRAEHLPTQTVIYIGGGLNTQHRNRQLAIEAMEFILTHPEFKP